MMNGSFGWWGDGGGWERSLPRLERWIEANRYEVIVGDARWCLKDRLKDPRVPLLPRSRQTMSSRLSGVLVGQTRTATFLSSVNGCTREGVGATSFRKPS